jgi:pyruvate formate lyase activating enzyme
LQKDLFDFCKKIKALWFKVKLDTNWWYPELLQKLLDWELLDYVAMDIKNPIDRYNEISWINTNIEKYTKSIEIIKKSEIEYEFRTTLVSWIHDEKSVEDISKQ